MHLSNMCLVLACLVLSASGCTTINIIFTGSDSGPRPILVDAGVPMADSGHAPIDAFVAPDADDVSSLTVLLYIDSPPSTTLPRNATGVTLAVFDFLSGSTPVTITGLTMHRVGAGSSDDFSNLYLYNRVTGERLSTGRTINRVTGMVAFNGLSLPQGPYSFTTLELRGDVRALSAGGQHAFEIFDASYVTAGTEIRGSFPVVANAMTIGTLETSRLDIRALGTPPDPMIGVYSPIADFTAGVDGRIRIDTITLTQAGSVAMSDLTLLHLSDGTRFIDDSVRVEGSRIFFDITPAYELTVWGTRTLSVYATVTGPVGRTIRLYVEYPVDVRALDEDLGTMGAVCIAPTATGGCDLPDQGSYDGTIPGTYSEVTTR